MIYSASFPGSDDIVLSDSLDGNSAYLQMFCVIFKFCAQVKFATLNGNLAYDSNGHRTENLRDSNMNQLFTGGPWD